MEDEKKTISNQIEPELQDDDEPERELTEEELKAEMERIRQLVATRPKEEKTAELTYLMEQQELFIKVAKELGCKVVSSEEIQKKYLNSGVTNESE